VAAPSANRFGRVSPTTAAHVQSELGEELLILDGGPCSLGIESTIVDCTRGVPVLLRPGSINTEALAQACGQSVLSASEFVSAATRAAADGAGRDAGLAAANTALPAAPRASGTLESHYAPRAKVRLFDAQALQTALQTWRADLGAPQAPGVSSPLATALPMASARVTQTSPAPEAACATGAALATTPAFASASAPASLPPQLGVYARSFIPQAAPGLLCQPMPATAAQTAQELFAVLRLLDDAGVQEIWVERVPAAPDWAGVADRLQRASA